MNPFFHQINKTKQNQDEDVEEKDPEAVRPEELPRPPAEDGVEDASATGLIPASLDPFGVTAATVRQFSSLFYATA